MRNVYYMVFPGGSVVKNLPANAGDVGSIPGLEDPMEEEMATHSSVLTLGNPRDGGAWWASVYGVAQSRTRLKQLSSSSSSH